MSKKTVFILCLIIAICAFASCSSADFEKTNYNSAPKPSQIAQAELKGKINGESYEHPLLKIGFTLPDEWRFLKDDEIEKNFGVDTTPKDNVKYFCDMSAISEDSKSNLSVVIEKKDEGTMGLSLDALIKNTVELVENEYKQVYDSTNIEKTDVEIDGQVHKGYVSEVSFEGNTLYQISFMVDLQDYLATVSVSCFEKDIADKIINNFYALN